MLAPFEPARTICAVIKSLPWARLIRSPCSAIPFFASVALSTWDAGAADLPSQQPALPALAAPAAKPCFASVYDFLTSGPDDCPLSWKGVTLYGRLDYGVGYESHGAPFNGNYPNGVNTLIKKNGDQSHVTIAPNGLGQSYIGVKGKEPIASDWSLVFNLQNGFDPYTLQRANGPKSLVQNNTTPLDQQTANGDSSRAGQLFNTEAYAGLSHPTFGMLTAGRQNSLILQGLGDYDAMGAAPAFSVIGVSSTAGGGGDTENARYNTSVKYQVDAGPLRFSALYQFGGFNQGNGSNGAFSTEVEARFGAFSFDAVGQKVKDAVALSNFGQFPLPAGVPLNGLKATLSDKASGLLAARYEFDRATIYTGLEYILFANPSDAYPDGFTAIGNYPVPAGFVNATAYDRTQDPADLLGWRQICASGRHRHRRRLLSLLSERLQYEPLHGRRPVRVELPRRPQRLHRHDRLPSFKAGHRLRRLHVVAGYRRAGERLSQSRQFCAHDRRAGGVLKPPHAFGRAGEPRRAV